MDIKIQRCYTRIEILSITRGYVSFKYAVRICRMGIYSNVSDNYSATLHGTCDMFGCVHVFAYGRMYIGNGRGIYR